ncbi:MAG: hypothetical protein UR27_C0001G0019 [Candidatus Peregrinibacteria bacterium GW2011_GWA2_33_10]|nr:MAG: hypothetical protein UR27_C0001G0019 [Candidatus Peregrinibacteria bacterium GW2011_GWA2_33_10]KKP39749.1 MAG: hypothetical protein UR30_C0008G0018 [Candidatus Peregrinibacteria bacterium GW2011_GWC2_33_13]OGJ50437.1 MAG: hypothetical protein A2229_02445 [Candidatus Peregrinibacteria bacterium RIFOXYA2_FULL_33_7]
MSQKTINQEQNSGLNSEKPIKISITLPTNAYFMSGIRDFTLSLTKNITGFSGQWSYRFQSVVDELCNNAIEHGSSKDQEIKITFFSIIGNFIEIYVEDTGTGPSQKSAAEMNKLMRERKSEEFLQNIGLRGRGLPQIVSSWTDEQEFIDRKSGKGLIVRVKKYLHDEENKNLEKDGLSNKSSNIILKS